MTPPPPQDHRSPALLVTLASMVAIGPLTIDMYLPAMPGMVDSLSTNSTQVQLTISAYLVGFSLFHLACGPLADRFGRRPVLLIGLGLYVLASLGCAASATIEQLIAFRFLQGVVACVGPTLGRTVARDLYGPQDAARALAIIAMIMALAPAVAPTLGSLMLELLPWPAIFIALAVYAALVAVLVGLRLPESLPVVQSIHPLHILRNYLLLLRHAHYRTTTVASALLYAGMVGFLTSSGFVFIEMMDVSIRYFGAVFLTTVAGYICGSALSTRLGASRASSEQVMWIGVQVSAAGAVGLLLAPLIWFHPVAIVIPISLYVMGLGITLPHALAAALRDFARMAGTASALFGFIQMALSALAAATVAGLLRDTPLPMALVIVACTAVAAVLIWRLRRGDVAY